MSNSYIIEHGITEDEHDEVIREANEAQEQAKQDKPAPTSDDLFDSVWAR